VKKVYLLPNFLTLCNLFCGYWALTFILKGLYSQACVMIFVSIVFDGVDGKVARLTQTESRFGLEFDSLCDLMAFGMVPACMVYFMFKDNPALEKIAFLGAFMFVACGALRLARYNIQCGNEEKKGFTGLPIPCAAGTVAAFVFLSQKVGTFVSPFIALLLFIGLAILMVSSVPYPRIAIPFRKRHSLEYLVGGMVAIGLLVKFPLQFLVLFFGIYVVWGLFAYVKQHVFAHHTSDENVQEEIYPK